MSTLPPVSDLTTHLGFWLRMVSNHVSHAFAARLDARNVTVAEWCLLRALYDAKPIAPSTLASSMGLTRGAITRLADRLIAKSLVTRKADPADRRAQRLSLTRRGVELVPELALIADLNDAEFFSSLTAAERSALVHVLKRIAERGEITAVPLE